jgi:catalase
MPLTTDERLLALSGETIAVFDKASGGVHPGFRPAHAKAILLRGVFTPSPEAASLTRAPHLQRNSTPVTVRFSDFAGIPTVPDNDPQGASPRGFAVRFHLGEHVHTDIIGHSVDNFPARTAEGLLEFLNALIATDPAGPHPNASSSSSARIPRLRHLCRFRSPFRPALRRSRFSRYPHSSLPTGTAWAAMGAIGCCRSRGTNILARPTPLRSPDFLFDEIKERVAKEPVRFRVAVQLADDGDITDDATVRWPEERPQRAFGELTLNEIVADNAGEQQHIIFDPIPRVDGIEASADPLFEPRANVYLMSGRRRRAAGEH